MLKVRLQRVGKKHEPIFRLVLTDSKNATRSGKFLEILGSYDPRHNDKTSLKTDRIKHLISTGAQLTDTVHNLLIGNKVIEGKKINVLPKKKPIIKEESDEEKVAKTEAPAETPVTETAQEDSAENVSEPETTPTEGSTEPKEDKPQDEVAG
jgi:small subunit ribosomal protein S16